MDSVPKKVKRRGGRPASFVDATCAECGITFTLPTWKYNDKIRLCHNLYCSLECSVKHRQKNSKLLEKECPTCGKRFKTYRATYCSRECSDEAKRKEPAKYICKFCGKEFESRFKVIYCSRDCYIHDRFGITKHTRFLEVVSGYSEETQRLFLDGVTVEELLYD